LELIEGIDMRKFHKASVDEKAKMIPIKILEEIKLGP
jgi:hypothetical protein